MKTRWQNHIDGGWGDNGGDGLRKSARPCSTPVERCRRIRDHCRNWRAGHVFVNAWYAGGVETPAGGCGKSGYGREKGHEAFWNYVQTKSDAIRLKG